MKNLLGGFAGISVGCALVVLAGITANARPSGKTADTTRQPSNGPSQGAPSSAGAADISTNQQPSQNTTARDPGVRAGIGDAGAPIPGLSADELQKFHEGQAAFMAVYSVGGSAPGEPASGLGPKFNSNSCGSCHSQPAIGGTSPSVNPQFAAAADNGATNVIPSFITKDGPVRVARFPWIMFSDGTVSTIPDGNVHDLFTVVGRKDAPADIDILQPRFAVLLPLNNVMFRIPTPLFGAGLIDNISEATIRANMAANAALKKSLGISGHPNISSNDGMASRFGWKAQNETIESFAKDARNVEIGAIKNSDPAIAAEIATFLNFIHFLAPPTPSVEGIPGNPSAQSIANGHALFSKVHCDLCHTPALQTEASATPGLSKQQAALFSDLLLHHMGSGLADSITQDEAGHDEFRTAPLWGVGQCLFFLHDGRATPSNGGLLMAIEAHASPGSEANDVIDLFEKLTDQEKQDLLNFLRSL